MSDPAGRLLNVGPALRIYDPPDGAKAKYMISLLTRECDSMRRNCEQVHSYTKKTDLGRCPSQKPVCGELQFMRQYEPETSRCSVAANDIRVAAEMTLDKDAHPVLKGDGCNRTIASLDFSIHSLALAGAVHIRPQRLNICHLLKLADQNLSLSR
jgi:hypothetical protein